MMLFSVVTWLTVNNGHTETDNSLKQLGDKIRHLFYE